MRTRKSQGKERPSLPRAGELRPIETIGERSEKRAPAGRFAKGNEAAKGAGPKRLISKATSTADLAPDEAVVARDTRRLHLATLREVPGASDSTIVRTNAYGFARESSLAAYYDAQANAAGLSTPEGIAHAERATAHRRVAERLSVTLLAEAATLAKSRPAQPFTWLPPAPELATSEPDDSPSLDVGPSEAIEAPTDDDAGEDCASPAEPSTRRASPERDTRVSPIAPEPDTEPRARLAGNPTWGQRRDGSWGPIQPIPRARPSKEALATMRERGLDTSRWERES